MIVKPTKKFNVTVFDKNMVHLVYIINFRMLKTKVSSKYPSSIRICKYHIHIQYKYGSLIKVSMQHMTAPIPILRCLDFNRNNK